MDDLVFDFEAFREFVNDALKGSREKYLLCRGNDIVREAYVSLMLLGVPVNKLPHEDNFILYHLYPEKDKRNFSYTRNLLFAQRYVEYSPCDIVDMSKFFINIAEDDIELSDADIGGIL